MKKNNSKTRKILISIVAATIICFSLSSCGEKEIPMEQICIGENNITENIVLEVEEEATLPFLTTELDEVDVKLSQENENYKIKDGELTLCFDQVGDFQIPLVFNAKGYSETNATVGVSVIPHKMPLEVLLLTTPSDLKTAKPISDGKVAFENKSQISFLINTEEGADINVSSDEVVSHKLENNVLTLTGEKVGTTTLKIESTLENYETSSFSFSVEVVPQKTNLNLSQNSLSINLNENSSVKIDTLDGANIELSYPSEIFNAVVVDNNLKITALNYGKGVVKVKSTKDGFLPNEQSIVVNVPYPKTSVSLDNNQLELKKGESAEVKFSVNYEDSNITIKTSSGDAISQADGNSVKITAGENDSQVKVIANHPNGGTDEKTITVKIRKETPISELPQDKMERDIIYYTNQYREKCGVAPLRYASDVDVASRIRAKEASKKWSHTRPDGTKFFTVFDECNLSKKYTHTGENLFMSNYEPTAKEVVDKWIESPSHEENLRRKDFTGVSICFYSVGDGEYYCSQLFVE